MAKIRFLCQTIEVAEHDVHVITLRDRQQFEDDGGEAERLGISEASWPLFGVVWDSSRVLAEMMSTQDVEGLRILEVGSGIGLASLVLNRRGADITATDQHPRAPGLLARNTALNEDPPIPFVRAGWADESDELGTFDLLVGSDLLYDPGAAALLAAFVDRHGKERCEFILVDPGRGYVSKLRKALQARGFEQIRTDMIGTAADDGVKPMRVVAFAR
ncbi:MAG: histidine kinase [Proteobacteria bacterium]|nr:histidine kinase [Pseudomonadota bacterium]MCP4922190.1 histidine kinase [Pseudomonadota bacterium]